MENMELEIQKLKETIKWYKDYSKVIYANRPNLDEYACEYADKQQELRNK